MVLLTSILLMVFFIFGFIIAKLLKFLLIKFANSITRIHPIRLRRLVIGRSHKSHTLHTMSVIFSILKCQCMDYLSNIKQSFTIDFDTFGFTDGAWVMFGDGSMSEFLEFTPSHDNYTQFDEVIYYFANYGNRVYQKTTKLIFYYDSNIGSYYLFTGEGVDYYVIESVGSEGTYYLDCLPHNEDAGELEDLSSVLGYARYNTSSVTNYTYGSLFVSFADDEVFLMDLYNIKEFTNGTEFPAGYNNYMVVRGEDTSFSKYIGEFGFDTLNSLKISYGSFYYDSAKTNYQSGYGNGYTDGYTAGNRDGFYNGQRSGNIDSTSGTAFSYIGTAFSVVSNILELEVLPHVTLGLAFSIPMTFILIMTIFKLVKK